jgi:hypothetical protein
MSAGESLYSKIAAGTLNAFHVEPALFDNSTWYSNTSKADPEAAVHGITRVPSLDDHTGVPMLGAGIVATTAATVLSRAVDLAATFPNLSMASM